MREEFISTYETAFADGLSNDTGTICGTLIDDTKQRQPQPGLRVMLSDHSAQPFYFNRGIVHTGQKHTGYDGRFCFFNVPAGPVGIHVFQGEDAISTVIASSFGASSNFIDISVYDDHPLSLRLGSLPSAQEMSIDSNLAHSLKLVDMVDLVPMGRDELMSYQNAGLVEVVDGMTVLNGRNYALSKAGDFEDALYPMEANGRASLAMLLPRGFINDMAHEARVNSKERAPGQADRRMADNEPINQDPDLGSVFVSHQAFADQPEGAEIFLLDVDGRSVGVGYIYDGLPITKAIFFNVPPGTYTLKVETPDEAWLSSDVVVVYSGITTVVQSGSDYSLK